MLFDGSEQYAVLHSGEPGVLNAALCAAFRRQMHGKVPFAVRGLEFRV